MMLGWSATGTRVDGASGTVSNENWTGIRLAVGQKDADHRNYPLWIRDVAEIRVNSGAAEPPGALGGGSQESVMRTLKADVTVKEGVAYATNTAKQIKDAIDDVSDEGGGRQNSKTLLIDAATQEDDGDTYKTIYTLPADALGVLVGDGMTGIGLITDQGSIHFSAQLLKYLDNNSNGNSSGPLIIEFEAIDAGGDLAAVDITIRRGDSAIRTFGGNLLKINIPFDPNGQEDGLVVYYIGEDGSKTLVKLAAYDQETHSMRIAVNHLSKFIVGYNLAAFDDIQEHWAKGYIEFLASRQIVNGRSAYAFDPGGNVTRAEFAKMLAEMADGADIAGTDRTANRSADSATGNAMGSIGFSDVPADAWYAKYVGWAANLGVVQGYPDGTFQPNSLIAREDMAVMTERFIMAMKYELKNVREAVTFVDQANISAYATAAVVANTQYGILGGNPDGMFNPKGTANRAEAAKVAAELIKAILK
jgi:hypothetical protein